MAINTQVHQAQTINELAEDINAINREKGFWAEDSFYLIPTKLNLIHDEVAEASEVYREEYDGDDEDADTYMSPRQEADFTEELADIIIRTLDLAAQHNFDIGYSITDKIEKNRERPRKHGKRY